MAESTTNLFELSFTEINAMKKKDLASNIKNSKGKVIIDNNIKNFCDQVFRLSENLIKLIEPNAKLSSLFLVVKKVDRCVTELEKVK